MPTTDFSDINLTDNSLNSGSAFNLVGNPYPSFISANTLLNTNDILKEATIWIWNQNTNNYDTYNLATDFFIAPTQSFFVKTDDNRNSFSITENMQSHQLETFQKSKKLQIQLQVSNSNSNRNTSIYYIKNTTINFDNGYDSNIFEGITNEFSVYTGLVSNNSIEKLGIQSLPTTNFEEMIIPIGLISKAGTITFSIKKQYLPNEYTIYLEDRLTNNIVNLSQQNNTYTINLDKSVHGTGRFYLHTKTNSLDINTSKLASIRVYLLNKNTLNIEGIQGGKTQIKIFDILGKIVFENTLQSNGIDSIKLPSLSNGTYFLKINSNLGIVHQKILIH